MVAVILEKHQGVAAESCPKLCKIHPCVQALSFCVCWWQDAVNFKSELLGQRSMQKELCMPLGANVGGCWS